jgi:hypothetical protein
VRTAGLENELDALRAGLEGLLSCFEGQHFPAANEIEACWARVLLSFERVRAVLAEHPASPDSQERLDDCLRLYAVARGVLGRRRSELVAEQAACSTARARLRRRAPAGSPGGSCDVRA